MWPSSPSLPTSGLHSTRLLPSHPAAAVMLPPLLRGRGGGLSVGVEWPSSKDTRRIFLITTFSSHLFFFFFLKNPSISQFPRHQWKCQKKRCYDTLSNNLLQRIKVEDAANFGVLQWHAFAHLALLMKQYKSMLHDASQPRTRCHCSKLLTQCFSLMENITGC